MSQKMKTVQPASMAGLSAALDFIENALKMYRLSHKQIYEALLLSEESMVRLIEHTTEDKTLHLSVRYCRGLARITISAPGSEIVSGGDRMDLQAQDGDMSRGTEAAIRQMLLKAHSDRLQCVRKGAYNFVRITAGSPEHIFLIRMCLSFLLAVILGLLMNVLLPDSVKSGLDSFLLTPMQTIFINTLQLAAGPTIFFSILTSVARFASFSDPER